MKLPSIRRLKEDALDTFTRFPFALFSAVVGTIASILVVENDYLSSSLYQSFYNISLIGFLGISLFCSLQLIAERTRRMFSTAVAGKFILLGLLVAYYFILPTNIFEANSIHLIRYFLFIIAAHLLVAVGPFIEEGHLNAFWEYNKILFLRILTAALYSGVLYAGLAIALAAIDHLFNVDINERRYFQLWWLLAGIFNTWFFLSGVPKRLGSLDGEPRYPKGLKIFTQYVLIPLVVIYVLILYAYMGKIIVEWDWPKGWVGYLVIGFSVTGIFSLLLVHPIKNQLKNKWMASIWKWFFYILLPLVVLLLLAVWRRISEYGITERRYFVIVLGLWLAAIALYFIFSRVKNIKLIPLSLCIIALATSLGPWGAFGVSEWNQVNRLKETLAKNDILIDGKIKKEHKEVSFDDARRISSIIRYMSEVHGFGSIQTWFEEKLDTLMNYSDASSYYKSQESARRVVEILDVRYVSEYETRESDQGTVNFSFIVNSPYVMETKQHRYLISNISLNAWTDTVNFFIDKQRWSVIFHPDSSAIIFVPQYNVSAGFSVDLRKFTARLSSRYGTYDYMNNGVPQDSMTLPVIHNNIRMILCFESFQVMKYESGTRPLSVTMSILMNP